MKRKLKTYLGRTIRDIERKIKGNEALEAVFKQPLWRSTRVMTQKLRVFTQGQKRGVTDTVKKMMKRYAAIEPVIDHIKNEHRMARNYLAHTTGDAINAILAAAGYNFRFLLNGLRSFLCLCRLALFPIRKAAQA